MLLRPLFFTSFLIDDQLADEGLATRGPIVISSASSKTAIGAAFLLARREGVELIGLTSPRNAEFVEGLGIYGRTVTYDAIDSLERARPPSSTSRATGRCAARSIRTTATSSSTAWPWGSPIGRSSAPAAASCPGPHRSSSSPPTGSSSGPRTGVLPASRRAWPTPGTRSASGPGGGSK